MIKAVIFDMDGVLIDSEVEYVTRFSALFKELGLPFTKEDASNLVGSSAQRTDEILTDLLQGVWDIDTFWKRWKEDLVRTPIDYRSIRVEGALEVIRELKKQGYKVGLASATEYDHIIEEMKACQLYEYFDTIASGHEFEESKPHPAVYIAAMQRLGVQPQECVVVEDSKYGIEAGTRAGAYVLGRCVDAFEIDQSRAHEIIRDLREVHTVLDRIQGS